MSPDRPAGAGSWREHGPGLAAAALAVLVYAATLGFDAAYDDQFVFRSPLLAHPFDLGQVLSGGFYSRAERGIGLYRPLGQWSLVLNAALAGSADRWALFHAVNVLLHAAASFLVYAWIRSLGRARPGLSKWIAGCTALLWAAHPTHAEVAANVTARYESLALVLGLGFLLAHRAGPRMRAWIAPALFLAALGCKESAVAFLPLAALADLLFPVESRRWRTADWIGAAAALALWFGLRAAALSGATPPPVYVENPVAEGPGWIRVLTAAKVQLLYLRDQALPLWLSTDHSFAHLRAVTSALDPCVLGFVAIAIAAAVLAWRARTRAPAATLAVAGWALLFAPASNILIPIGTIMADRLAYAPSIFTCLLAALLLARIASEGTRTATASVLVAALALVSFREARAWRDDVALGLAQVRTAPESAKAHGNLADALRRDGRLVEAVPEYLRSIEIYPWRPKPHQGLAQTYEFLGEDPEKSLESWLRSIRYGTPAGEAVVDAALDAADVGDWTGFAASRARMAETDPDDWRLVSADGALSAAERLLREPKDGRDWARGQELLGREAFADAESSLLRALHGRDVPEGKLAATLRDVARCNLKLGRGGRAERFQRLAAETRGS